MKLPTVPVALLALAALAGLAAPALAAPDGTSVSCEPPTVAGRLVALPCTVEGDVTSAFKVFVYFGQGEYGSVVVDAKGPASNIRFVCPVANTVAACVGPVTTGPAYAGHWTFTARPAVADANGNAFVKMLVAID